MKEISKILETSSGSVRHHIEKLKKRNMVEHTGIPKRKMDSKIIQRRNRQNQENKV